MIESDSLTGKIRKGRLVGQIRAGGGCLRVGELSKILRKRNRKEGRGNKDFKKGGANWVKGWMPYKWGAETPLRTMIYIYIYILYIYIFNFWYVIVLLLIANIFIFL